MRVRFEWDPDKDAANQKKHSGIAFRSAALVFDDPRLVLRKDRIVEGQQRWHAIGVAGNAVLLVVHTSIEERNGEEEVIRIISARQANQRERRIYLQQAAE